MTQCHVPPFTLPTEFRSNLSHWPLIGSNASVVPGIMVAPTLPWTFDSLGSWAKVGRSPQVGSITACPARNRFQPCPSVQLIASFGPQGRNFTYCSNARRWPSELIRGFMVSGLNQKYLLFGEQTEGAANVKKWKKPCSFTFACKAIPQSFWPSPFQSHPV